MVSVLMIAGEMVSKAAKPRMRLENENRPKGREEGEGCRISAWKNGFLFCYVLGAGGSETV